MRADQKSEGPGGAGPIAVVKQNKEVPIVATIGDDGKAVASLIARFALVGHAVHKLAGGGFIVSRWGMTRECPDTAALTAFLRQIGGAA